MQKLLLSTCLASSLALTTCAFAEDLNIWNWSDYIAENTVQNFEKATGLKPNYALFDSNELV